MRHNQEQRITWAANTSGILLWSGGTLTALLHPGNAPTDLAHPAILWALLGWIPCLIVLGVVSSVATHIANALRKEMRVESEGAATAPTALRMTPGLPSLRKGVSSVLWRRFRGTPELRNAQGLRPVGTTGRTT